MIFKQLIFLALCVALGPPGVAKGRDVAGTRGIIFDFPFLEPLRKNNSSAKQTYRKRLTPEQAQLRKTNSEIQTALNYFGFEVGVADGAFGRKTRFEIANFQSHMEFPRTGTLTRPEQAYLLASYERAQRGGPDIDRIKSGHPDGTKGLLIYFCENQSAVIIGEPARQSRIENAFPDIPDRPDISDGPKHETKVARCLKTNLNGGPTSGFSSEDTKVNPRAPAAE